MKVIQGDSTHEVVFRQGKDGSWDNGSTTRVDRDEPREPKKPKQPKPAAAAKPAQDPVKDPAKEQPAPQPETLADKLLQNSGLGPVPPVNKQP
jgi:hypothetical protein